MDAAQFARGFRYAGVHAGLRPDPTRRDVALIVSDRPAAAAGVFTQNRVCAAPVQVSRRRVPSAQARGIVICSGNANACTGLQGLADAELMSQVLAEFLDVPAESILVASTGVIGRPLPMPTVVAGIRQAQAQLAADGAAFDAAAHAIMTTDTRIKTAHRTVSEESGVYRLSGLAKGAAMIGPHMATMLAFLMTDAAVPAAELQAILTRAVARSFTCISVEGPMSPNDTGLLRANGAAGAPPLAGGELCRFEAAVTDVATALAQAIVDDAEGASHVLTLEVEGLPTEAAARQVAKVVAESALVKTAIFGHDPNWGRIVSAAGYAGIPFREEDLSLWLGGTLLYDRGQPVAFDAAKLSAEMKANREISARLLFTLGPARCRFWTCDLTPEYVRLNADYTT
ncbi:MAG TPA: bifunctional glutamate N-acetyltransferase/amino-acid acetyltransferase ArgJ [Gemmatales bacterium]|nr:bifunctional glutamate N-acetyltransferase/amino-acid acetyltransferase ArgJ [Gemmatales bacterium]